MKVKWSAITAMALVVIAITAYKVHRKQATIGAQGLPRVLLVADLSEADSADASRDHSRGTGST